MKEDLSVADMPCERSASDAAWFRLDALMSHMLTTLKRITLPDSAAGRVSTPP